ncbi:MAG: TlpA disulfide reductase family protein [bacterium]
MRNVIKFGKIITYVGRYLFGRNAWFLKEITQQYLFLWFCCFLYARDMVIQLSKKKTGKKITAAYVRTSIEAYIKEEIKLKGGFFLQYDEKEDKTWKLLFDNVNQRVRRLQGNVYAAGVDFKTSGDDPDHVNLDFYMKRTGNKLEPQQVKIHIVNGKERYKYRVKTKTKKGSSSSSTLDGAPDFTLLNMEGKKVRLSQFYGKVVILNFWATWCPPCKAEIPDFMDLYTKYKDKGVEMIGISLDPDGAQAVDRFMEQIKINYTVLIGNMKVSSLYGDIDAIPTSFVITPKGGIYKKYVGYRSRDVFEQDIKALLE